MFFTQPLLGTFDLLWFIPPQGGNGEEERSTQRKVKGKGEGGGKERRDENNFFTHLR